MSAMVATKNSKKIAAWSSYWSEGNVTSLPNLFAENYGGDVLRFWNESFATLRDDSRLLDICTGNGAIALLARDYADHRKIRCKIHAVDVAEIQPISHERGAPTSNAVQFHSGVAVETTHCRSGFFDLIVGQFALEYCNTEAAVQELSRIAKESGTLVLMMHHADSLTAQRTREFIDIAEDFLKEPTVFYRLRKYAEQSFRHRSANARQVAQKRQQLIESLNEANRLSSRFPNNRFLSVTLDNLKHLADRVHNDPKMRMEEIREFERIVTHHLVRMRDQRDASLDSDMINNIRELLIRNGFSSVHYEPYFLGRDLFAWTLKASRGCQT